MKLPRSTRLFRRMPHPESIPEESMFTPCVPSFFDEVTVPPWDSLVIEEMGLTKKEQDIYFDLTEKISELNGNSGTVNRLLGYPDQVQGEMQLECQLVTQGIYCGDSTCGDVPGLTDYKKDAGDWRLLFQLDSLEDIGMMWGDLGRIYYWIKKRDLEEHRFDNVWLVLQCG